ncbi:putative TCP transcription factor [Forsythia ovata]|uniref:TCP transcription factor n=1 Tax=Forsythia ovata TaxID=205694 RepID=A0ABD1WRJ4_9LAMI
MEVDEIQAHGCRFSRTSNGLIHKVDDHQKDDEDGEQKSGGGVDLSGGGGGLGRKDGWSSSRIVMVFRASGGKDQHNKALTSANIGLTHKVDDHQKDDKDEERKRGGGVDLNGDGGCGLGRFYCWSSSRNVRVCRASRWKRYAQQSSDLR